MMYFERPDKPEDFDEKSSKQLKKLKDLASKNISTIKFNDNFWRSYKSYFSKAQYRKCAYCDMHTSEVGDVEHYRPKSTIYSLKAQGDEQEGLQTVKGRLYEKDCEYGYWWMAYEWDNYLYACSICNRTWKSALFPLENERERLVGDEKYRYKSPCVNSYADETPLLLNPYDTKNTSEHFEFTKTGMIKPKAQSKHGKATIETVGLDRTSLVEFRSEVADMAYELIEAFALSSEASVVDQSGKMLLKLGKDSAQFSGMVRIMFEQYAKDFSWFDLVEYYAEKE